MATVTLKNSEFLNLESEINGLVNQQENRLILRGLINENMKLSTKIKLSDLTKKLAVELNAIAEKRNELVVKHGEAQEDGTTFVPMFINIQTNEQGEVVSRDPNPKFEEFQQEYQPFLNEEKEFECELFTQQDLEGAYSEFNYPTFYKLVKSED